MSTPIDDPDLGSAAASDAEPTTSKPKSSDAANWAKPGGGLKVTGSPGSGPRTVEGRKVMSPVQGFGKMWQKTYKISLGQDLDPTEVIRVWKENFPKFWPPGNTFYAPLTGIAPGEVAVLNLSMPGKLKLSTGVLVLYADDESFTLMTPQGHMLAGWITFSAYEKRDGTVAQAQVLMRANDPLFELGLTFGGHKKEDNFWEHTLTSLAAYFDRTGEVKTDTICVDPKRQWRHWKNIWHNSAIRSGIYMTGAPVRVIARPFHRKPKNAQTERGPLEND